MRIVILSESASEGSLFPMCQRCSSCPALPGSLCPDAALSLLNPSFRTNFYFPFSIFRNSFACHTSAKSAAKRASDKDASPACPEHSRRERAQRVEGSQPSVKSCVCHRSEKSAAKFFPCHTSKNALPQVLYLPHIQDPPRGTRHRAQCHPEPKARDLLSSFAFRFSFLSALP